jgi:hexosaminidase
MKSYKTVTSALGIVLSLTLCSSGIKAQAGIAQNINIIPQPASVTKGVGEFVLRSAQGVTFNDRSLMGQAKYLKSELYSLNKIQLQVGKSTYHSLKLILSKQKATEGSYQLVISNHSISITSSSREGIFYGIQSLLQLVEKNSNSTSSVTLPALTIDDFPRYQWRGFMLDESRHFFGKEKVEMLIKWMARYKLNKFHWHLTDAHGWRIAITKYPKLTTIGATGNYTDSLAPAKYYSQADIKEIVSYAKKYFITIIPEIDMPGHASAANRAYPEYSGGSVPGFPDFTFNPAKEQTYKYLSDIIKETNQLFPDHLFHLGGDEVADGMQAWLRNPAITDMMARKKFKTPNELEFYFFKRMADTVKKLGNKILCWDEATGADLPADKTIIFWWRQNKPEQLKLALQKNYQVVLCPRLPMYFDFVQDSSHVAGRKWKGEAFNRFSDVYNYPDKQTDPIELKSKNIIGIQANIWTETIGTEKRLDYMIFPRLAALAEAAWAVPANKDLSSFENKLKAELQLYAHSHIYYYDPFNPGLHPEPVDFVSQNQE